MPVVKASLVAQMVENLLAMWEIWVPFLGQEDPLEKGKAMHPQYSCLEDSMDSGAWQATIQKFPEMCARPW